MYKTPTVAVLMATYNGEKFLKEQLDSIFSQSYKNIKIYVADDCSTDSTAKILLKYQKQYPQNFFCIFNQKNIGFVQNFEKLLKGAKEEYVALCDQDDIWFKNKIEVQVNVMLELEKQNNKNACLVHSDLQMIDEKSNLRGTSYFKYRKYHLKDKRDLGHILGPCGVMGNTILINKALRSLVLPFPKNLDLHDYWIAVNCELFGKRKTLTIPLVKYRVHCSNTSNSSSKLSKKKYIKFNRNIQLPNLETNRKYYLPELLSKIKSKDDILVLKTYIEYLNFNKNRLYIFNSLIRYSLVKRDLYFRMKLFFKIIFTNRY